jgi:hypothetical protein
MKILRLLFFGAVISILASLLLVLASLPFQMKQEADAVELNSVDALLAALPLGLVSYACAWLNRTASRRDAWISSLTWTLFLMVVLALLGVANQTLDVLFLAPGLYVLFLLVFLGPLVFARVRRLH